MTTGLIGYRAAHNPITGGGGGGGGTVLFDAVSSANGDLAGSFSWTHTPVSPTPSGAVCMMGWFNGEYNTVLTGAKYGGVSFVQNCTLKGPIGTNIDHGSGPDQGNYWQVVLLGLPNPPSGPQTVQIDFSGLDIYPSVGVITVTGSDLTNIFRATGVTNSGTSTTPTLVIPSATGDMAIDVLAGGSSWSGSGMNGLFVTNFAASPNARRWQQAMVEFTVNSFTTAGSTLAASGSSATMGWTKTGDAAAYWLMAGASIKAATVPVATLNLSSNTALDNATINSFIGTFSVTSGTGTYTYSFISNPGTLFNISGSSLRVNAPLSAGTDLITVQADNGAGSVVTQAFSIVVSASGTAAWYRLPIGGGGQVTGMSISLDGITKVISTDSGGASVSTSNGAWQQLMLNGTPMPTGEFSQLNRQGSSYSIAVAPSDSQRIYLYCGGQAPSGFPATYPYVYKSINGGASFTRLTASPATLFADGNTAFKFVNPRMAVDPINPNVMLFSCDSLYYFGTGSGISATSPAVCSAANNFVTGTQLTFVTDGTSPAGMTMGVVNSTAGTTYKVSVAGLSSTAFRFETLGGTPINCTTTGSGNFWIHIQDTYITLDGGTTFTSIPSVPKGGPHGPDMGICFDPASGTVASPTRTAGIYVFSQGNGSYHSTDGGVTFAAVGGANNPTFATGCSISLDGVYYVCNDSYTVGGTAGVWRRQSGAWTKLTLPGSATNPVCCATSTFSADNGRLLVINSVNANAGIVFNSANYGATFGSNITPVFASTSPQPVWLQNATQSSPATAQIVMDPITQNKIWAVNGLGVWYSTQQTSSPTTWNNQSAGIEELVTNRLISVPGGAVFGAFWDRGVFQFPTIPTTTYPTNQTWDAAVEIADADGIEYASSNTSVIVASNYRPSGLYGGKSTTGGAFGTWSAFAGDASPSFSGTNCAIAASSTSIYMQVNGNGVFYTTNGGAAWTNIPPATFGHGMTTNAGWQVSLYAYRANLCADRVAADTFYVQNYDIAANGGAIYKIVFSGGVPTVTIGSTLYSGTPSGYGLMMQCVPGYSGYGFITSGENQSFSTTLQWTQNGFTTLSQIAGWGEVYAFGIGLAKPGNNFPTLYVVGTYSGVFGIYRGDGNLANWQAGSNTGSTVTWTKIGDFPLGCASVIKTIEGDKNIWNRCYVGTPTGGCFYFG